MKVGILTVSDSCSQGEAEDTSGANLAELVRNSKFGNSVTDIVRKCVPDEKGEIRKALESWADDLNLNLILTTGGTGFSARDITPEATREVINREAPGIVHRMISKSLEVTPLAMLARGIAGIRNETLIINFPGSQKGSSECFQFVAEALPHAVQLLTDQKAAVKKTHQELQQSGVHNHQQGQQGHVCPHKLDGDIKSQADVSRVALRDRASPFPMISVQEAQRVVKEKCSDAISSNSKYETDQSEIVNFEDSLGRILADDVTAGDPLPPFPASVKDGYAVVSADGAGVRAVVAASFAGIEHSTLEIRSGQCARINTGAPIPKGADAVVQVEDTELVKSTEDEREELEIKILKAPVPQQDIRKIGSDLAQGSLVLKKCTRIGPAEVGLLATVGAVEVKVTKRSKVVLLSTGNELQDPNTKVLKEGAIRDSNKSTLKALLIQNGIPFHDAGIAIDDPNVLASKLREGLAKGDVLVTTGGVSMGDRDILRQVLVQDFGAEIHFARVNMKPGKPTTFATLNFDNRKNLVLGLPGNPVSALVTAHLYLIPICRQMSRDPFPYPAIIRAVLNFPVKRLDMRPEYRRVILKWKSGQAFAEDTGNQMSCRLSSCSEANGLILLPGRSEEKNSLEQGVQLDAIVIDSLRRF